MEAVFSALGREISGELLEDGPLLTGALERYLLLLHDGPLAEGARREALETLKAARAQADGLRRALWGDETEGLRPPYPAHLQALADFSQAAVPRAGERRQRLRHHLSMEGQGALPRGTRPRR